MRLLLAIVPVLIAGCDPGWTYHEASRHMPTSAPAEARASEPATLSLKLLEARLFAGGLHLRTTVVNAAAELRTLDSASLQVLDAQGSPLKTVRVGGCAIGYPTARLSSCSPEGDFSVNPGDFTFNPMKPFRRNPALREVTVRVQGVTGSRRHVVLTLLLEWDN